MTKLYVGNLSFDATQDDLRSLFDTHGTVTDVLIPQNRMTRTSRGFAFVTMDTQSEAEAAIAALNETHQNGRKIAVNIAEPREERSAKPQREYLTR